MEDMVAVVMIVEVQQACSLGKLQERQPCAGDEKYVVSQILPHLSGVAARALLLLDPLGCLDHCHPVDPRWRSSSPAGQYPQMRHACACALVETEEAVAQLVYRGGTQG